MGVVVAALAPVFLLIVVGGTMFDCSELMEQKQHALAAYQSQLAYNDFKHNSVRRRFWVNEK